MCNAGIVTTALSALPEKMTKVEGDRETHYVYVYNVSLCKYGGAELKRVSYLFRKIINLAFVGKSTAKCG